jgi:hypothetical protein
MHRREWTLLFSEYDLRLVLEAQLKQVGSRVLAIPNERFKLASDEYLAAQIASDLTVTPLEIVDDEISVSSRDAEIDISQDPNRLIMDRSRPFYRDGIEVTYHIPYRGDEQLLKCRPGSFTLNPPRAVISRHELRFPYDHPDRDVAATKSWFNEDLASLRQWLPWVNEQVAAYNGSLEENARQRVVQRRAELDRTEVDLASLGFKVRSTGPATLSPGESPGVVRNRRASIRKRLRREYDVALSFAGEDRAYVERVAEKLRELDVSVFYDAFEQVDLWGTDLAEHLGNVYSKDSRFVVLFLSRNYASKAWPTHEKRFALARHLGGDEQRVLPVRFDETEIPGLPPTLGYLDLRVLTPEKLAELIRQKVDITEVDV